jgi:hypothetical protein
MVSPYSFYETELEALPELTSEMEMEFEDGRESIPEGELESEQFFGGLAQLVAKGAQSPALRRLGLNAAKSALKGINLGPLSGLGDLAGLLGESEGEWEGQGEFELELEGPSNEDRYYEDRLNEDRLYEDRLYETGLGESDRYYETEDRMYESGLSESDRLFTDALMEHLGHMAAQTESEAEAEAFLGALIPLAAKFILPKLAPMLMRSAPNLIRGVTQVARTLRANPATRQLVRTLPNVVQNTVNNIARQAAQGRNVTPQAAVRTLATQTARVISNPRRSTQAYRRSRALDRRFHRHCTQINIGPFITRR